MPTLFWGFVAIVVVVLGLALVALRSQAQAPDRRKDTGDSLGGNWWITDAGSGDCSDGGDGGCD